MITNIGRIVPLVGQLTGDAKQISVDTRDPGERRLTFDPFDGRAFCEVGADELHGVLRAIDCRALEDRVLRLYRLGYALPDHLWLGVVPRATGCIVKGYVSSVEPLHRAWLPQLARDAGWLPVGMGAAFLTLYERLVPGLAVVEGIGITCSADAWLGTTLYLRSGLPWLAYASAPMAALLSLDPPCALVELTEIFTEAPSAFGWSLECDAGGGLVDLKAEIALRSAYARERVTAFAVRHAIDTSAFDVLASEISAAGLASASPEPAVLSVRFVKGAVSSMVAYFPVRETREIEYGSA